MKKFIVSMFTAGDAVSSKRVTAFTGLLLLVGTVVCKLCQVQVEMDLVYALMGFVLTCQGLTMFSTQPKQNI
jgi:hypothetical protein